MPATKHQQRREAIRQLLRQGPVPTQGLIAAALTAEGFGVTQSSISRDLKEVGAIRTVDGYELPSGRRDDDDQLAAVSDLLRTVQPAGPNLLVVRTAIGAAQRVALAFDRSHWPEIIGNIGGDDTVFVATDSGLAQKNLISRIERSARSQSRSET